VHARLNARANASAAFAAVLFGASVVAVRIAVRDVPPLTLAFLRFAQGSLVILAGLALFRRDLLRVERRDVPYLAMLGLLFYAVFAITFNVGVRYTEASRAAVIIATMPLWTVVLSRFVVRERPTLRQVVGVLTSIAGVAIVMLNRGGTGNGSMKGDTLLLTTAFCGATYNILAKRVLERYGGLTMTFYAMFFGAVFLLPATLVLEGPIDFTTVNGKTLGLVIFLGVFGGALGFSLWTSALRQLSPTQVSVYINLNPIAATLLAATFLRERLSGSFLIGFVAVVAGVMIVNWTPRVISSAARDLGPGPQ
jgi:drug/metabolite transporter (DMT)-like permease